MQISQRSSLTIGLPSPALENPDMILPWRDQPSVSAYSQNATSASPQQFQTSPDMQQRSTFSEQIDSKKRLKPAAQNLSPFRNGVLTHPGGPTRARSITEKGSEGGNGRIKYENARLSYRPVNEAPYASPPTLRDEYNIAEEERRPALGDDVSVADSNIYDNTYTTPAILEEDEDDPNSHLAMSKRAEEILANAKIRLTNMEGNLNRAKTTLNSRPSSSMSSFTNQGDEPRSMYSLPNDRINVTGYTTSKHRQPMSVNDQRHARISSETAVPSSLHTGLAQGGYGPDGLGIHNVDINQQSDSSQRWFWNGLNRQTSLAHRQNNTLQPLHEHGPAPESFQRHRGIREDVDDDIGNSFSMRGEEPVRSATSLDVARPSSGRLTRARSTTQVRDIRDQMQDLKGKISNLKQRARQDSLYRRSLQNLRTPSPFTAADQTEQWYTGVPLAAERQTSQERRAIESLRKEQVEPQEDEKVYIIDKQSPLPQDSCEDDEPAEFGEHKLKSIEREQRQTIVASPTNENLVDNNGHNEGTVIDARHDQPQDGNEAKALPTDLAMNDGADGDRDSQKDYDGRSLEEAETTDASPVQLPVGERHEDRPDAFDYEHFFLHSGMGHYSKQRNRHGRRRTNSSSSSSSTTSSHSSENSMYSIETTRPNKTTDQTSSGSEEEPQKEVPARSTSHVRNFSAECSSTSSLATYATASESKAPVDDDGESESTPRNTIVAPPRSDSLKHRRTNGIVPALEDKDNTTPSKTRRVPHQRHRSTTQASTGVHSTSSSISAPMRSAPRSRNGSGSSKSPTPSTTGGIASIATTPDLLTYLAAQAPGSEEPIPTKAIQLGDRDRELTERLVRSLAKVAIELEALSVAGEGKGKTYEARVCRRKLDAARRVLDGEVNGEAF